MLRVVTTSPSTTYIKNRLPSSAATLAAGIDGLVNRLQLPDDDKTKEKLPSSLTEALSALEADEVLCAALNKEFIEWFWR